MHRIKRLERRKIVANMVKMTKANRFAHKKLDFIDKGASWLYNLTIRTGIIHILVY